jgi:UDP-N-acetylmuramate: L-alanyl-gamma-D-glutamyl-meso-diaminopimelate ligase
MQDNKTSKKAHFIGIAGKGMSATALLLKQQGWEISGSDEGFYPPVSDYLKHANIPFAEGYKKANIPTDADVIVIGKNAKLVPETNEEVRAAFESGKPIKSFPDILEELTEKTDNIVVAGSYGKSTCTGLLAWCLKEAGKDPSYFIGEVTKGFDTYAHLGKGNVFVLEGDEYPTANWDPIPKFLHYNPKNILLTSATHDHVNIYPTHDEYLKPFKELLSIIPHDGLLVVNTGEHFAKGLAENYPGKKVFYSLNSGPNWHPKNIHYGMPTTFDLYQGEIPIVSLTTSLLGTHNVENIVGVSALVLEKKLLTPEELAKGVASFEGTKRRMELLSPHSTIPVYEGFGSSYEKAKSAIAAAKLHYPDHRLIVFFEPHTFTWRNRTSLRYYDDVFRGGDKIFIYEPASQGASTHAQLTQDEIVQRVQKAGYDAHSISDPQTALSTLDSELKPDDLVLILTSGDIGGLIKTIPALVEKKFPK